MYYKNEKVVGIHDDIFVFINVYNKITFPMSFQL